MASLTQTLRTTLEKVMVLNTAIYPNVCVTLRPALKKVMERNTAVHPNVCVTLRTLRTVNCDTENRIGDGYDA